MLDNPSLHGQGMPAHASPCPELRGAIRRVEDIEDRINDPRTGLGAHTQALNNNTKQMDRIEGAIAELHGRMDREQLMLMAALASAVVTMVATLLKVTGH